MADTRFFDCDSHKIHRYILKNFLTDTYNRIV